MSNAAIGKDTHMLKFLLALVAVPGAMLALATATAAQTFPPNLPMAITCYDLKIRAGASPISAGSPRMAMPSTKGPED